MRGSAARGPEARRAKLAKVPTAIAGGMPAEGRGARVIACEAHSQIVTWIALSKGTSHTHTGPKGPSLAASAGLGGLSAAAYLGAIAYPSP